MVYKSGPPAQHPQPRGPIFWSDPLKFKSLFRTWDHQGTRMSSTWGVLKSLTVLEFPFSIPDATQCFSDATHTSSAHTDGSDRAPWLAHFQEGSSKSRWLMLASQKFLFEYWVRFGCQSNIKYSNGGKGGSN